MGRCPERSKECDKGYRRVAEKVAGTVIEYAIPTESLVSQNPLSVFRKNEVVKPWGCLSPDMVRFESFPALLKTLEV